MTRTVLLYTDSHSFCGVGVINAVLLEALQDAGVAEAPAARVGVFVGNAWDPAEGRETPWIDLARQLTGVCSHRAGVSFHRRSALPWATALATADGSSPSACLHKAT